MKQALVVGIGAGLGAVSRYSLGLLAAGITGIVMLAFINAVGCFLMGRLRPGPFLGTGFLGGFTSFSTFAATLAAPTTASLSSPVGPIGAGVVAISTVSACLVAWWAGDMLADAQGLRP